MPNISPLLMQTYKVNLRVKMMVVPFGNFMEQDAPKVFTLCVTWNDRERSDKKSTIKVN